ncbi:hypothetical protein RZ64_01470 [[Haemophilus] ducreyi]|nr:hypothetical protein RZ64_01470 [[Haemophilus] ducreyi]
MEHLLSIFVKSVFTNYPRWWLVSSEWFILISTKCVLYHRFCDLGDQNLETRASGEIRWNIF